MRSCSARDATNPKRWGNAVFWGLIAVSFWFGDLLGDIGNGVLVLALVAIAGIGIAGAGIEAIHQRPSSARSFSARYGNRLFLPALIIPLTAFAGTLLFNYTPLKAVGLIDPKAVTLVLLGARRHLGAARLLCLASSAAARAASRKAGG